MRSEKRAEESGEELSSARMRQESSSSTPDNSRKTRKVINSRRSTKREQAELQGRADRVEEDSDRTTNTLGTPEIIKANATLSTFPPAPASHSKKRDNRL